MAKKRKPNRQGILRYARSRSFMPVSELRRYFEIESDDGTVLADEQGKIYISLPSEIAQTVFGLVGEGKLGLEYSAEFEVRVVIGVYPRWQSREIPAESEAEIEDLATDLPILPLDDAKRA